MSEQETPRTVEEAARAEAERRWPELGATQHINLRAAFRAGASWQAARMPSVEQVAEVHEAHTFAGTKDIVALCSCGTAGLVNALNEAPAWHRRHQAEQVVALWGAL